MHGYAFYGTGTIRNGSNSVGIKYGKPLKANGTLKICLNMFEGTLKFGMENDDFGIAFTNESLKVVPIWPAVALLHKASCVLRAGVSLPDMFKSNK